MYHIPPPVAAVAKTLAIALAADIVYVVKVPVIVLVPETITDDVLVLVAVSEVPFRPFVKLTPP